MRSDDEDSWWYDGRCHRPSVDDGALSLISYGPDTVAQYRRAAGYVDRILKEAAAQLDWPWKITATIRRPCYGPSSARDLKVLAGNWLPFAARTAFSSTLKPRPGPSGSAMYPSTGRSTFGHSR
jgi:hypothetical protein